MVIYMSKSVKTEFDRLEHKIKEAATKQANTLMAWTIFGSSILIVTTLAITRLAYRQFPNIPTWVLVLIFVGVAVNIGMMFYLLFKRWLDEHLGANNPVASLRARQEELFIQAGGKLEVLRVHGVVVKEE